VAPLRLPDPPLSDGVVTVRGFRESDAQDIFEACQDLEIPRWTIRVPWPYLIGHARDFIARQPEVLRAGEAAHFAITDARDGSFLGNIGLELETHSGMPEVGYWLAAHARGSGTATRAARLVCDWGFGALGLARIGLRTHKENLASQAVAARAGFVPAGTATGKDRDGVTREFLFFTREAPDQGDV
jgi:RimJ/RimL family protein N-acetyltransferase